MPITTTRHGQFAKRRSVAGATLAPKAGELAANFIGSWRLRFASVPQSPIGWRRILTRGSARLGTRDAKAPACHCPGVASHHQICITRDGDAAIIEYADPRVRTTRFTFGREKLATTTGASVEPHLGKTVVSIDDCEVTLCEFLRMIGPFEGWGLRITYVVDEEFNVRPEIEGQEPDEVE